MCHLPLPLNYRIHNDSAVGSTVMPQMRHFEGVCMQHHGAHAPAVLLKTRYDASAGQVPPTQRLKAQRSSHRHTLEWLNYHIGLLDLPQTIKS